MAKARGKSKGGKTTSTSKPAKPAAKKPAAQKPAAKSAPKQSAKKPSARGTKKAPCLEVDDCLLDRDRFAEPVSLHAAIVIELGDYCIIVRFLLVSFHSISANILDYKNSTS